MIVVGYGGHAHEVMDALEAQRASTAPIMWGPHFFAVEKAFLPEKTSHGEIVLDLSTDGLVGSKTFIVAIGDIPTRRRIVEGIAKRWIFKEMMEFSVFGTAVHPSSVHSIRAVFREGAQILYQAALGHNAWLGKHSILNAGAILCHDARVGDFCNIGPGAILCGGAVVEDGCDIGCGARILPRMTVKAGATVGAGAVVACPIPPGETWVGVPAHPLAYRKSPAHGRPYNEVD